MKSHRSAIVGQIRREMGKRHAAAGMVVQNEAKRRAPVDTGRLKASITHEAEEGGVIIGTNTPYAIYQELGTRYMNPQPYLVPGLLSSVPTLQRIYGREME